ncbi:hypothetical protein FJT64_004294 [Amphibalanus amphitrite]|nr:uncharacterized protein LOC122365415 [Amphibalanus amphitrite]XP_043192562.1 uncharacterized protein LOC122365415 [Amphibalanus amphitrite]KAF0298348.1 hypothetical protein FJT64_004294 [Amphibalanus amphitrite]
MRCVLVLAMLAVAAHGASISSSVSASSSSDGRESTFSSHRINGGPTFTLGTRGSFGSFGARRQPAAAAFSPLGTRGAFGRPAAPGLGDVQAELNRVAGQLAGAQSSLQG